MLKDILVSCFYLLWNNPLSNSYSFLIHKMILASVLFSCTTNHFLVDVILVQYINIKDSARLVRFTKACSPPHYHANPISQIGYPIPSHHTLPGAPDVRLYKAAYTETV